MWQKLGQSDRTGGVHARLFHSTDCAPEVLSPECLFGSFCQCRYLRAGRSDRGDDRTTTPSRKIIQPSPQSLSPIDFKLGQYPPGEPLATASDRCARDGDNGRLEGVRLWAGKSAYDFDHMRGEADKQKENHGGRQPTRLHPIDGRHNLLVKQLRGAFARGELTPDGHCAIEGVRIVEEALRSGLKFRAVFFSRSAEAKAQRLLPQIAAHVETLLLPNRIFAAAVPSETPQGVAALVRCREFSLEDVLAKADSGPLVAIAGIQDPGNLGTILRSAEAFGAGGVILGEGTAGIFNSKVIRAADDMYSEVNNMAR